MSGDGEGSGPNGGNAPKDDDLLQNPVYNWLSIFGALVAIGGLTATAFFVVIGFVVHEGSGYAGLTIIPPLLLAMIGMGMFVFGVVRERWRQKRGRHSSFHRRWVIDPSSIIRGVSPWVIGLGIVVGALIVSGGGAGSLMLVEFTESNSFCGEVCHTVMTPEATVFEHSPHSQFDCVECHVGEGGDSYVRAKLNGLVQIYSAATNSFDRPIPTPVHNLRSSTDMCEGCHVRGRFIDYKAVTRHYFVSGEEVVPGDLQLLMKIGGANDGMGGGAGIHYHMLVAHEMEFVARDPQRQEIAWVRVTDADGEVKEYSLESNPLTDEERGSLEARKIECVDCHSRPTHQFPSPVRSVNAALRSGRISPDIPYIKQAAVTALDGDYATTAEAMEGIGARLRDFYDEEYPEVLEENGSDIEGSVEELKGIYRKTIFPEMKADWSAHPDNSGHLEWPGCFRCHNDDMVDGEGEPIFTDCNKCHVILSQGEGKIELRADFSGGEDFVHPEDLETMDEFTLCSECHTGGADIYE